MDSVSVISISSSSSDAGSPTRNKSTLNSIMSISSETQRVPVSWERSKRVTGQIGGLKTPHHSEKVKNWIYSCNEESSPIPVDSDPDDTEETTSNTICIQYNFEKNNQTTPLVSYLKKNQDTVLNNNLGISRSKSADLMNKSNNMYKTCINTYNSVMMSPETHKKELCNYLQLMKPSMKTHKTKLTPENRRSLRVRNLNKLTEQNGKSADSDQLNIPTICANLQDIEKVVEKVVTYPTMKSFKELNMKIDKLEEFLQINNKNNRYLPLPPQTYYKSEVDFEQAIRENFADELRQKELNIAREKKRQKQAKLKSIKRKPIYSNIRLNSIILRSGKLRRRCLPQMLNKKTVKAKKKPPHKPQPIVVLQPLPADVQKDVEVSSAGCEILSVHTNSDDENVDLRNFVDDMLELDKMSEEHRKSVIESRIVAASSISNMISKKTCKGEDLQRAYQIFADLSTKNNDEIQENNFKDAAVIVEDEVNARVNNNETSADEEVVEFNINDVIKVIAVEHQYARREHSDDDEVEDGESMRNSEDDDDEEEDTQSVSIKNPEIIPVNHNVKIKSLHRSLMVPTKRKLFTNNTDPTMHVWSEEDSKQGPKKLNHFIAISHSDGAVLRAFYIDYNLIVVQQSVVTFWTQSALGNILGAQNMWVPKGRVPCVPLRNRYLYKDAKEMVVSTECSVAYIELWTKEHKSDIRQDPLTDVFAPIYFWRHRQKGLDCKVLQLENIKGFAADVQYVVLKGTPKIVVSWYLIQENEKKTNIHCYHLATDFQTVANISQIQAVSHYVSSLHNIEDCDTLVMGCGENKVTVWNIEYGYIVATIELLEISAPLSTVWVKCDRGFLFVVQECADNELHLIAINGMNLSWKKLQNYNPSCEFNGLKGVCVENGILVAFYSQGLICWNAQTGEPVLEEVPVNETKYIPSGRYIVMIVKDEIIVRHALSHLITVDDV